jgi:hypothetical protein
MGAKNGAFLQKARVFHLGKFFIVTQSFQVRLFLGFMVTMKFFKPNALAYFDNVSKKVYCIGAWPYITGTDSSLTFSLPPLEH